jgi:isoquinoline 1-oxidoreductase beta subunit
MVMGNDNIDPERRKFLKVSMIAGYGLVVGIQPSGCGENINVSASTKSNSEDEFIANAWIRIQKDDVVTIMVSHSEMGQGISTALPMIVAEELEADWSKVHFEMAPVADVYKHPKFGIQWTVSSMSVHSSWDRWREAGAAMRELLILAAARSWEVSGAECRAEKSIVIHQPSGKSLRYGELINLTDGISIPEKVRLKEPHEFKIIGQPKLRLDSRPKIDGRATFGIDVKIPGMLIATVVHPPVFGTGVRSLNPEKALAMPGVEKVLVIETGIAILANTFWQAIEAMDVLEVEWKENENRHISTELLFKRWTEMGKEEGKSFYETGGIDEYFKGATKPVEATYDLPHQAHATPEPMNCTAHVTKDGCEIWVPTQNPKGAQEIAARITGLNNEQVKVHTTFLGGGFGRRVLVDYVGEAVEISQRVNAPVKVIWTREEDVRRDFYRAATHNVLKAVIDDKGHPIAWFHRIVGADVFGQTLPKVISGMMPDSVPRFLKNMATSSAETLVPRFVAGRKAIKGAGPLPYDIPNMRVEFINDDPGIPLCWWRSVAPSTNCFAVESFVDELAAVSAKDPYELRYELLAQAPRLRHVVKLVADKAGWYRRPPKGIHLGIAAHDFQSTMMAMVAEVSVNQYGEVNVHRVVCAVDCGIAVNPKTIEAQVQSAVVFGLTATIKSSITIKDGKTVEGNFDDFPLLRMDEMPKVETHIVPSTNPPTGIGEVAVPLIAPAVVNAIFFATGKRVRKLPVTSRDLIHTLD